MSKENKFAYIAGAAAFLEVSIYIIRNVIAYLNNPDSISLGPRTFLFWIFLASLGTMLFMKKIHIGLTFPILWFIFSYPIAILISKTIYRSLYSLVQTIGWVFMLALVILAIRYKQGEPLESIKALAIIPCILFALSGCVEFFEYRFYEFHMYESAFLWGNFRFFFRSVFLDFIITLFMGLWICEKLASYNVTPQHSFSNPM